LVDKAPSGVGDVLTAVTLVRHPAVATSITAQMAADKRVQNTLTDIEDSKMRDSLTNFTTLYNLSRHEEGSVMVKNGIVW
jgi:hypothetical protein